MNEYLTDSIKFYGGLALGLAVFAANVWAVLQ